MATKIELRVVPAPEAVRTLLAFFDDSGAAGEAVTGIVSAGIVPAAIEMMDRLAIRATEQATRAGYRLDAAAALIVELDGSEEECATRFDVVQDLCAQAGDGTSGWPRPSRSAS